MHDLQCTASRCDSQATYRTSYLQQSREERRRDAVGGELHVCGIGRKEVRDGCIVSRAWGTKVIGWQKSPFVQSSSSCRKLAVLLTTRLTRRTYLSDTPYGMGTVPFTSRTRLRGFHRQNTETHGTDGATTSRTGLCNTCVVAVIKACPLGTPG
jgi:hypothetical protein